MTEVAGTGNGVIACSSKVVKPAFFRSRTTGLKLDGSLPSGMRVEESASKPNLDAGTLIDSMFGDRSV